jgi:murein DD-endopeptidase MepM/ murein hydrolase activator NlpD
MAASYNGMNPLRALCAGVGIALAGAACAAESPPALRLPLECTPGENCWIVNYVDLDPGGGARDYACGRFTYDGHRGTDFALRDLAALREGVKVLAAAPGVVRGVRDGEEDVSVRERPGGRSEIEGRECGNAVRIDHGGGWQTLYCHMRRGSVAVRRGEPVSAGQMLGLVGLSGQTEFPHLHFGVSHEGKNLDPFGSEPRAEGCATPGPALWESATAAALPYAPGAIYNFGVAPQVPAVREVRDGAWRERSLPRDAPLVVVWAEIYNATGGEVLRFAVEGPDGAPFLERRVVIRRSGAREFGAFKRERGAQPWSSGTYRVTIGYDKREAGRPPAEIRFNFEIQ